MRRQVRSLAGRAKVGPDGMSPSTSIPSVSIPLILNANVNTTDQRKLEKPLPNVRPADVTVCSPAGAAPVHTTFDLRLEPLRWVRMRTVVTPDWQARELCCLAIDQVFTGTWRGFSRFSWRWLSMAVVSMDEREHANTFVWKQGKDLVTLSKAGESWQVSCLTQGRLMGPRLKIYEAMHRQAKFAAWDVMARVISVTHDEEEGVEVAVRAAQWMRRSDATGPSTRGA